MAVESDRRRKLAGDSVVRRSVDGAHEGAGTPLAVSPVSVSRAAKNMVNASPPTMAVVMIFRSKGHSLALSRSLPPFNQSLALAIWTGASCSCSSALIARTKPERRQHLQLVPKQSYTTKTEETC